VQVCVYEINKTLARARLRVNRCLDIWVNLDEMAISGTAQMKCFLVDNHVRLDCRFIFQRQKNSIPVKFCPWVGIIFQLKNLLLHAGLIALEAIVIAIDVSTPSFRLDQLFQLFFTENDFLKTNNVGFEFV